MSSSVRPVRPGDQAAIADICFQTGFMGESVCGRFEDRALFALLFAAPYLAYAPARCWVAVADARVVGYCLTVADTRAYRRWHGDVHRRTVLRHIAASTLWRSPKDVLRLLRWDTAPKLEASPELMDSYPAHFHINVSPGYQRQGVGRGLIAAAFAHLQGCRSPGVHLRTTSRNASALAFYQQLGFATLAVGEATMWRLPGVQALLMGRRF